MDFFSDDVAGTFSTRGTTASPGLTVDALLKTKQMLDAQRQKFTRAAWQALAAQYGLHRFACADPQAVDRFEHALCLEQSCRPAWLHISKYCLADVIVFLMCVCFCHSTDLPWVTRITPCDCPCIKEV